jgi:hypothetical protein
MLALAIAANKEFEAAFDASARKVQPASTA